MAGCGTLLDRAKAGFIMMALVDAGSILGLWNFSDFNGF